MPDLEVHLLDPGAIEYGDCVLCLADGKSVLIDAGKKASAKETRDTVLGREVIHSPIQEQIESINGSATVDLLIITHCHSDHVGALPALIRDGVISSKWALIADPQLGFGIGGDSGPLPPVDRMSPAEKLWLALREEPFHSANDAEVRAFIEDAASEYHDYGALAEFLKSKLGDRCVHYKGPAESDSTGLDALLGEFAGTGLKILGPSLKQLGNCAKFLVGRSEDVADLEVDLTKEGRVDLVAVYRRQLALAAAQADGGALQMSVRPDVSSIPTSGVGARGSASAAYEAVRAAADDIGGEDTPENGNAVNNQSLVLTIGQGAARTLLAADMQFASPQLSDDGVKKEMQALRDAINDDVIRNGRFGFIKLSHHGATNGHNAKMLASWGADFFGISTGSASTKHPTAPTLAGLKALKAASGRVQWGRTDLNGRITYKASGDRRTLLKERGRWNDLTPPAQRAGDAGPLESAEPAPTTSRPPSISVAPPSVPSSAAIRTADGQVEVIVRYPYGKGQVRVTIETEREGSSFPLT